MTYLQKFETKSARAKGVSFHPKRSWVLTSLHSGVIQLWDYRSCTLIDKYDEHEGPVRGLDFHKDQPLFVSGGDDFKIRVWNYKQKKCLFPLLGHIDYIRTTFFHHEYPWILSASDDQTIRIWNWQSRNVLSILTGHTHYVMCAQFHPNEDLIVSASLDQTARVWDISGLRKKNFTPRGNESKLSLHGSGGPGSISFVNGVSSTELFGNCDAVVKHVLEGHDRGVNWVQFHPKMPLVVSCGDDRYIKIWRLSETKAWELETLRGHVSNINCVMFHPRQDSLLSISEDKTIRVWDLAKKSCVATFRRDLDRFWIIAVHPTLNLFGAAHDSGIVVFKLERERPAHTIYKSKMLYVKGRQLRSVDFGTEKDVALFSVGKERSQVTGLRYNPTENMILVISSHNSSNSDFIYELFPVNNESTGDSKGSSIGGSSPCIDAIWIGRSKFVVLENNKTLGIRNTANEKVKRIDLDFAVDTIFPGGSTGHILLKGSSGSSTISLMDVTNNRKLEKCNNVKGIKRVVWSDDNSYVALMSKLNLYLYTKDLKMLATVHETVRIKSGVWDKNEVFVYTTPNHIKYCLYNGDGGIVRTLETPVYLTKMHNENLYCLDRQCQSLIMQVDTTEYRFKLAIIKKRFDQVLEMMKNNQLVGQAVISYLEKKGYPEIALHFVKDPKTRFDLAIECGQLDIAVEAAKVLDNKFFWEKLIQPSLKQGNYSVTELAYQRLKDFNKISFFYLITGSMEKLKKMMKIAEVRNDTSSQFQTALLLGDVEERVKILLKSNKHSLAYLTAKTHGLEEIADSIKEKLENENESTVIPTLNSSAKLILPCLPVIPNENACTNWSMSKIGKDLFESFIEGNFDKTQQNVKKDDDFFSDACSEVNEDDVLSEDDILGKDGATGWDLNEELDFKAEIENSPSDDKDEIVKNNNTSEFLNPKNGPVIEEIWSENGNLVNDQVAAGNFKFAMRLLNDQLGVINFSPSSPLKPIFLSIYSASFGSVPVPFNSVLPSLIVPMSDNSHNSSQPIISLTLDMLISRLQSAYQLTTKGKFNEAVELFRHILLHVPILSVESDSENEEAKKLIKICKEYIVNLSMEIKRKQMLKEEPNEIVRIAELACYFTHANLEPEHSILTLRTAINLLFKMKNYKTAAQMARRLLDMKIPKDLEVQVKKILTVCEKDLKDANNLEYDSRNSFEVCAASYVPIYRGSKYVSDPFCDAKYLPQYKGETCRVTLVSEIGKSNTSGLTIIRKRSPNAFL